MKPIIFTLLICLLAHVSFGQQGNKPPKCRLNEVLVKCENPCQPSCVHPKRPPCPTLVCKAGCHCKPGYIRTTDSSTSPCIKSNTCPKPCSIKCKAEEVANCALDKCQPTCVFPNRVRCPKSSDKPGCECRKGFLKLTDSISKCVPIASCSKELDKICQMKDPHTFYNTACGGNCQVSCLPKPCIEICTPGCQCKPGYKADLKDKCVLEKKCPPIKG